MHFAIVSYHDAALSTTNTAPKCSIQHALPRLSLMAQPCPLHPPPPQVLSTSSPISTLYGPPRRAARNGVQTCVERYPTNDLLSQPTSPRTPHFKSFELPTCDLLGLQSGRHIDYEGACEECQVFLVYGWGRRGVEGVG
jgi:hypothetical protein